MSIKSSLYTFLISKTAITTLVSGVYPQTLPQQASAPAIVYSLDDEEMQQLLDGTSPLLEARVTIDCYSPSYAGADAIAAAVKTALIGHRGTFGSKVVDHLRKERELDLFEADTRLHRVNLQFLIAYY
jgi:hypothetical protein